MKSALHTLKIFLPYIFHTIYFNLRMLPLHQAIKLPILLYKPRFFKLDGKIIIPDEVCRFGIIRMGEFVNVCNPNNGVLFDFEDGSTLIFNGKATVANDTHFMLRYGSTVSLGRNIDINCKIKCAQSIVIGDETWIAYDSMIMDSDWHALTDVCTGKLLKKTSPVVIGKHNFISFGCTVLKGTKTPDFATFTPHSWLNKVYTGEKYSLFGGNPCQLIDEGYYLDHNNS